ncbi:MAG TPA: GNAT family protein [Anaerolineaceae bacterium]
MAELMRTERLILRPFEERDIAVFADYRSDPDVARYQGWNLPFSLDHAVEFFDEMKTHTLGEPGSWYQMALELKSSGVMIGDAAVKVLGEDQCQAEIGLTFARPYQGQGYGSEVTARLLEYLFEKLGLHRVRAGIDPQNIASARVLARNGLRHEARLIESLWLRGAWVDEDWYAILAQEWKVRKRSPV